MTGMEYSELHARRLLRSLGFSAKKVSKTADSVPPGREFEIWQKDIEEEVEVFENDDFTLMMAERHRNSNIFGSGAVYVRGDAEPVPTQPGSQRQTVYGGVTLDGQTCFMMAKKANDRSFIRYLDKLWCRLGKSAAIVDNVVYHDSRLVRRYLGENGGLVKLLFLLPYSPFLNLVSGCGARARQGYAGRSGGRPRATSGR